MTKRTIELLTPSVPNFIQTSIDKHMISVGDLTEDEILSLTQKWHDAMIENSKRIRYVRSLDENDELEEDFECG